VAGRIIHNLKQTMADNSHSHNHNRQRQQQLRSFSSRPGEHSKDTRTSTDAPFPITPRTRTMAILASGNSLLLGFDIGTTASVSQGATALFQLTDAQRGLFVGSINLFMIVGVLVNPFINDQYGRRACFGTSAIILLLGQAILYTAGSYTELMVGRAIAGIGFGVGLGVDVLYTTEISSSTHRGQVVAMTEAGIQMGLMLGSIMTYALAEIDTAARWRAIVSIGMVLPVVMIFLASFVLVESPRFLVIRGRNAQATAILEGLYPPGFPTHSVVVGIREALERERLAERSIGWSVIFCPTPAFRRMFLLGWGISFSQQAIGIDALQYYMTDVIAHAGIESTSEQAFYMIGMAVIKLQCIVLCGKMLDIQGRRFVLFLSLIGMAVSLGIVSLSFFLHQDVHLVVVMLGLTLYFGFEGLGVGPTSRLIASEIFPTSVRAKAMSVATIINRLAAAVMATTFFSVKDALTWPGIFMLLATVCVIVASLLYCYLPETNQRSLEDMSLYFSELTGDTSILDAEHKLREEANDARIAMLARV